MSLLTLTLILFLIMDPLGRIKAFLAILEGIAPKRQRAIVLRELFIALTVMLIFNFLGEHIFSLLQISDVTVYLSSGIILFLSSIKILFPKPDDQEIQKPNGEPLLVPLAIPMIAGPALLATIMLYAQSEPKIVPMLVAIFFAWLASGLIFLFAKQILKLLRPSGVTACEKLMGMVLVLLSVQRFLEGILLLFKNSTHV